MATPKLTSKRGLSKLQALGGVLILGSTVFGLGTQVRPAKNKEEALALARIKQVALATIMYQSDYDDLLPRVSSTQQIKKLIFPYIKNETMFESPRKGGKFVFNLNIGGVLSASIPNISDAILWYETVPDGIDPVVAYADGHAKYVRPEDMKLFKKRLAEKFKRDPTVIKDKG